MVKRLFKRSMAFLLTVLMIATSLPLTALADSQTDSVTTEKKVSIDAKTIGLITYDGKSRSSQISSGVYDYNIVYDGADASFTAAYWTYDTSALTKLNAETVKDAMFTYTKTNALNKCTGLSLYYAKDTAKADKLPAGNHNGKDSTSPVYGVYGENKKHREKLISALGLVFLGSTDAASLKGNTEADFQIQAADALNYAIQNKLSKLTFVLMQTSNGAGSGNGSNWSDTHIKASAPATITAKYSELIEVKPGLDGLNQQIEAYETKMSQLSSTNIYKNMAPAYKCYIEAIKYRDAYMYGTAGAPKQADVEKKADELALAIANMQKWEDDVTGKFKSEIPKFKSSSGEYTVNANPLSDGSSCYSNILYTELCTGTNYQDTTGSDRSGIAVSFNENDQGQVDEGKVAVEIYYPNTVLLYDGVTPARMPVMFMAYNFTIADRYIYHVFPAQNQFESWATKKTGESPTFKSVSFFTNQTADGWKGGNDTDKNLTMLDFNACRNNGEFQPSAQAKLTYQASGSNKASVTDLLWWRKKVFGVVRKPDWDAYAGSFQVYGDGFENEVLNDENTENRGFREVAMDWAWYGGTSKTPVDTFDAALSGYNQSKDIKLKDKSILAKRKSIYVFNYKYLTDAIKSLNLSNLTNVSNFKQNGLADLIAAVDNATNHAQDSEVRKVTFANVREKGQEYTNVANALVNTAVTPDSSFAYYDALKTEITKSKKIIGYGNEGNKNYTAEYWTPFENAYKAATAYFDNNYANLDTPIDVSSTQKLVEDLTAARENLKKGLKKDVVNTTALEIALHNAEDIVNNSQYLVANSINVTELQALVKNAKTIVWQSEANFGFDIEKLSKNDANQKTVDDFTTQLSALISGAKLNFESVTDIKYSLVSALAEAQTYEAKKKDYGNYASLQDVVQNANNFRANYTGFDPATENSVQNTVSTYITHVENIVNAIKGLKPAFSTIANGTPANNGKLKRTEFSSQKYPDWYKFYWEYQTDAIIFKKDHEGFTYTLPKSTMGALTQESGTDFDLLVDSIIFDSGILDRAEITLSDRKINKDWPSGDYGLKPNQLKDYAAKLNSNRLGATLSINSAKVTKATSKRQGVKSELDAGGGFQYVELGQDYDFINDLGKTDGVAPVPRGGIYSLGGNYTEFDTNTTITIPADRERNPDETHYKNGILTADSTPSALSLDIDYKSANVYFGLVYYWRWFTAFGGGWAGYGFENALFEHRTSFVNVSTLFDLIAQCSSPEFTANSNKYTKASWNNLIKALSEASTSDDFDYGNMTYEQILTELDRRYTNLWNAKENLQEAASNKKIIDALAEYKNDYETLEKDCKPDTWAKFVEAYNAAKAVTATGAIYSNDKISEVSKADQGLIDAYATNIINARNALITKVSFKPVDDAMTALATKISESVNSGKHYTKASFVALNTAIEGLKFYTMPPATRDTHYIDETTFVADLKKEADAIPNLFDILKEGEKNDETALDAAKTQLKSYLSDPDAYDQNKVNAALNSLKAEEQISCKAGNFTYTCRAYANQTEVDNAVANALSNIKLNQYTVTVISDGNTEPKTYNYGEEAEVWLKDKPEVDWYYEMTSPSGVQVAKKFYSRTDVLKFIVRGNTTLTTKKASSNQPQYRVTYVNGINSAIVQSDYVEANSTVTLNTSVAPSLPYYTLNAQTPFMVNGVKKAANEEITITKDTTITLLYDFSNATTYNVNIINLSNGYFEKNDVITGLKYNDELSFTAGNKADGYATGFGGENFNYQHTKYDDAKKSYVTETVTVGSSGRYFDSNPHVYAWLEVSADEIADWMQKADNYDKLGEGNSDLFKHNGDTPDGMYIYDFTEYAIKNTKARVVKYGEDYTFRVHEDIVLMPLSEDLYKKALAKGIIKSDFNNQDGVGIKTQSNLVITPSVKASIISSFALPQDCKLVEKGVLAKVKPNGAFSAQEYAELDNQLRLEKAGTNGIKRLKSNYTTKGDQFVISFNTDAIKGNNIKTDVGLAWVAYVTYEKDGKLITEYTPMATPTNAGTY